MNDRARQKRSTLAFYEELFKAATLGIVVIDKNGLIYQANPFACQLFGYELQELIGQPVEKLIPENIRTQHSKYRKSYFKAPQPRPMGSGRELFAVRRNGELFPVEISLSYTEADGEQLGIAFVSDITERKLADKVLQDYAKALERSNRNLQDFAYVSSHDLQEPLRKIRAFGDRIQLKDSGRLSDRGKDYLQRMLNAAERMQQLINDLLTFSRISTQAQSFEKVDLNEVVKKAVDDLDVSIEQNQVKLEIGSLPTIRAEPTQMWQLFQNLLSNAIKFKSPDRLPVIRIREKITSKDRSERFADRVMLEVEDNGIGFDPKYKDKIFQIFQRLEGKRYEGSGIGLAICKRIVHLHGGAIEVESQPGRGTRFIITLQRAQK